jgi:hypothetical protein
MKFRLFLSIFFLLNALGLSAQYDQPIMWEYKVNQIDEQSYELVCIAKIQRLWYLYGQHFSELGPARLNFVFDDSNNGESIELTGKTIENPTPQSFFDPIYNVDIQYFAGEATFTQKIKFKKKCNIKVYINGTAKNKITKMERTFSAEHLFKFD